MGREPVRQVEDCPRKEPRLRHTQKEPHHVKRRGATHEHRQCREDSPTDHDPSNPPSSSDPVKDDVARYLENEVAKKKDSRAEPENGLTELEILEHLQLRKADV